MIKIKKKILCIDYGYKRSGISITDSTNKIALGLCCIKSNNLLNFLKKIIIKENIYIIVLGEPKTLNNKNQDITIKIYEIKNKILNMFPKIRVELVDERFTSKLAEYWLYFMNIKKKNKKNKINIISSILILQSFLKKKKI
ncbi:MAG: Holliday junction resolvase RuvX [Candidatus Shikimatogenerans bostrichidophilus]|nr:MAG: Holliday junction resolvase RuvX [Candidatus Shikimatogenerans bostrichidophilus]